MSPRQPDPHREPLFDSITAGGAGDSFLFVDPPQETAPTKTVPAQKKAAAREKPVIETHRHKSVPRLMFLWGSLALLVLVASETLSAVTFAALEHQSFSFTRVTEMRAAIIGQNDRADVTAEGGSETVSGDAKLIVHPFLGYIQTPGDKWVTDAHGIFYGTKPLITAADPKKEIVGIFGGSLAEQFSAQGSEDLKAALSADPRFAGKEFTFIPVAFAGYKQPQQLIALNYLLSLGAHFDLLINIDGFNEVALSTSVNGPKNVSPFFPSSWAALVGDLPDTSSLGLIGKTVNLRDLRRFWAQLFQGPLGHVAVTPNIVWLTGDRLLSSSLGSAEKQLMTAERPTNARDLAMGPVTTTETDQQVLQSLADSWRRSSLQMAELAKAKGIPYYHFLQPNQYVPGSKTMDAAEQRTALNDASPYKPWVIAGYPLLQKAGNDLLAAGVHFTDLSQTFAETTEPVYGDDCCHLTQNGYGLLGQRIGAEILR